MSGAAGSSCGACKFLRRRCRNECVFAPYFCYSQAATHFAAVHKVFGASNVSKLLQNLPVQSRREAAVTVSYEAVARMQDPVYGCVGHIFALQQQVVNLREEIDTLGSQMAGVTVGAATSQAIDNQHNGLQLSSQPDATTVMQYYLNQQPPTLPHTANTTTNQLLDIQTNEQFPSLQGWEDNNLFMDSESCSLERLLEGMDQDILEYYPWLDNGNNAER